MKKYTVGIDFGSLSGRAVLMDLSDGTVVASSVYVYPHAVMDERLPDGTALPVDTALQHPQDYLDVLEHTLPSLLAQTGVTKDEVVGIGFDFTACTMLPLDKNYEPLCFSEKYISEPHAYVKLWKHHGAQAEANDLNRIATERGESWMKRYGDRVSAEWMIPKIMEILRKAPQVYEETERFVEAADWLSYVLTGTETHSAPFAGYKALWNEVNGFPSEDFFAALDPRMQSLIGTKLSAQTISVGDTAGTLCDKWAEKLGLNAGTPLATPVLDAHASMPALGIAEEEILMLVVGTSAVHLVHSREQRELSGICGYMKDGIIPGLYTYEAGQACCGDHFDWFVKNCVPEAYAVEAREKGMGIHQFLREKARVLRPGESGLIALDWFNGNRSVLADSSLRGMILGMTLRTKPEEIYRALIEGTAYGTRMIVDHFADSGIPIDKIVASGGIAEKDDMLMQIYADVLNRPIVVSDATMSASRGSAIYASVAAGEFQTVQDAVNVLSVRSGRNYVPIKENAEKYRALYEEYCVLHDYFGRGGNDVMKRLDRLRSRETD